MDFFETVQKRRSIRRFSPAPVPNSVMESAFQAAVLAPNSSNAQTWNFFWIKDPMIRSKVNEACLNQSAARTAADIVVVVASPMDWKRSHHPLIGWVKDAKAPAQVVLYYEKLLPNMYRWGIFNIFGLAKWFALNVIGLFRPIVRRPATKRDIQEVCIKSAALAAENFVLAISALGYSTCMMEGIDETRLKRILKLRSSDRVVMAIGVGEAAERGTWGPRFRIPLDQVVHIV
jgi:nitroreductase